MQSLHLIHWGRGSIRGDRERWHQASEENFLFRLNKDRARKLLDSEKLCGSIAEDTMRRKSRLTAQTTILTFPQLPAMQGTPLPSQPGGLLSQKWRAQGSGSKSCNWLIPQSFFKPSTAILGTLPTPPLTCPRHWRAHRSWDGQSG